MNETEHFLDIQNLFTSRWKNATILYTSKRFSRKSAKKWCVDGTYDAQNDTSVAAYSEIDIKQAWTECSINSWI